MTRIDKTCSWLDLEAGAHAFSLYATSERCRPGVDCESRSGRTHTSPSGNQLGSQLFSLGAWTTWGSTGIDALKIRRQRVLRL